MDKKDWISYNKKNIGWVIGFEGKIVETEKVLNGLIRTLQEYGPSVFSLQPMHLNSYSALKYKRKS